MLKQKLVSEMAGKISEVLAMSPARDMEKNLKASLSAWLSKLDLVTREEFDVQAQVLARTREKLAELEARLARLENAPGLKTRMNPGAIGLVDLLAAAARGAATAATGHSRSLPDFESPVPAQAGCRRPGAARDGARKDSR